MPDPALPVYLEYEVSPFGAELCLMIVNNGEHFMGWQPWPNPGRATARRAATVRGGPPEPGAAIEGWSAEMYLPYRLMSCLPNVPPRPGDTWRGNVTRIDYDHSTRTLWGWSPAVGNSFHRFEGFGSLVFG
jgi:hypothetical protein